MIRLFPDSLRTASDDNQKLIQETQQSSTERVNSLLSQLDSQSTIMNELQSKYESLLSMMSELKASIEAAGTDHCGMCGNGLLFNVFCRLWILYYSIFH